MREEDAPLHIRSMNVSCRPNGSKLILFFRDIRILKYLINNIIILNKVVQNTKNNTKNNILLFVITMYSRFL